MHDPHFTPHPPDALEQREGDGHVREEDTPRKEHDVGVLLVHGIGQQPEGDTLLAFGEPLVRWIDRWLRRDTAKGNTGTLEVLTTRLTPSRTSDAVPPHAIAQLHLNRAGSQTTSTWMLAESWWGGTVQPPPFGRLAGWLLTSGAWIAVAHTTKWARKYRNTWLRAVAEILTTIGGLLLAMLIQLAVLALSILAIPPIPALRRRLSSILLAMTGILGDCFVLVESDLQRGAIVTRTRAALEWLAARCKRVVVIAHSQGAAVAHYALRTALPPNVELLVTLGSGLGKLSELEHAGKTIGRVRSMARLAPLLVLLMALLGYITLFERRDNLSNVALYFVGFLVFVAVAWAVLTARQHWQDVGERARELSLDGLRRKFTWVDIHATKDPVPNGDLLPGGAGIKGMTSHAVMNYASALGDHTTYWQNRSEFIPRVLRDVDHALSLGLFSEEEERALEDLAQRHQRNVRWLTITKWATVLSVVLLFWRYGDVFLVQGREFAAALSGAGTPFDTIVARVQAIVMFVLRLIFRGNATTVAHHLLGAAIPLALIAVWQYAYRFLWRWWDGIGLENVFRPGTIGTADRAVLSTTVIGLGLVPLGLVLAWPMLDGILVGHVIAGAWIGLYVVLALLLVIQVTSRSIRLRSEILHGNPAAREKVKEDLKSLGGVFLLLAFILWITLPVFEPYHDAAGAVAGFGLAAFALIYMQVWYSRRVTATDGSGAFKRVLVFAPVLIAVSITAILAAILGPQRSEGGLPAASALLITLGLIYLLLLTVAAGIMKVLGRADGSDVKVREPR